MATLDFRWGIPSLQKKAAVDVPPRALITDKGDGDGGDVAVPFDSQAEQHPFGNLIPTLKYPPLCTLNPSSSPPPSWYSVGGASFCTATRTPPPSHPQIRLSLTLLLDSILQLSSSPFNDP